MKRTLLTLIAMLAVCLSWGQVSVGTRDNQYFYGSYQYKGWNVKLEESVYAEKIGFQYLRLYGGYTLFNPTWSISAQPYFGSTYNGDYQSMGCMLEGKYTLEDKYHFAVVVNPHYDTGYKYKTNFKLSAGMDLTHQIGIKAEYQEMPIYRMKEKRVKGGFIFKTGNLSVSPQLSIPAEGAINNIRCIVDFHYCFKK